MQNAGELRTSVQEIEVLQASINGLAENGVDLKKRGRRFMMQDDLTKLTKKGSSKVVHVYLFNDMILYTEKAGKKTPTQKYAGHNLLKDVLFIDSEDSKDRHIFELLDKEEKKRVKLVAKNYLTKITWKHYLETQIEKCCPTDACFGGEEDSGLNFGAGSRTSWAASTMDYFSIGPVGYDSHSDLEGSEDDRSGVTESPSPNGLSHLTDCSAGSGDESVEELTDDTKSEEEELDDPLVTVTRNENGSVVLAAGTLNAIMWWMNFYYLGDYSDPVLIRTFLCECTSYATPLDIFTNLMQIYDLTVPVPKAFTLRYSLCDTRKRVTAFLKLWLENYFDRDFATNKNLYLRLLFFFDVLKSNEQEFEANVLKITIIRVNKRRLIRKGYNRFSTHMTQTTKFGIPISRASLHTSSGMSSPTLKPTDSNFIDWSVTTVAEQFCLIEFDLYKKVELKELCKTAWKSHQPRKTALNVVNLYTRFDMVAQWVATEIVMAHQPRQRVSIIEKFIALAQKFLDLRNFNSLQEILAGLNRGSVARMKKAWEGISQSSYETFQALNIIFTPVRNYNNYRQLLRKNQVPCLPYVGVYLQDLVGAEEVPDKTGELINYDKIFVLTKILKDILHFQKTGYPFVEDENLQPALRRLLAMPEEMLYKHSQLTEPTISNQNNNPLST